jgi:hypothetical protein
MRHPIFRKMSHSKPDCVYITNDTLIAELFENK